jgi:hypothetical protein
MDEIFSSVFIGVHPQPFDCLLIQNLACKVLAPGGMTEC